MENKSVDETPDQVQRVAKIKSQTDLLRCMNWVHREVRKGFINTQDMGRYANFYQAFAGLLRDSELEERLTQLEERIASSTGIPIKQNNKGYGLNPKH